MASEHTSHSIGVFDSGSGGLSILQSIREVLPHESYIYFGDHAHIPYGNKTTAYIRERTATAISYLLAKHVKLLVIACNTSTIAGIDWYRKKFPQIPIVGVVPVIKTAAQISKTRRFVVLSTEYTAKSEYQKKLISEFGEDCIVSSVGSSLLVPLIENGIIDGPEIISELESKLSGYTQGQNDVLVLGCTHYPFLKPVLHAMMGTDIRILDSGGAVARQVERILRERNDLSHSLMPTVSYNTTGDVKKVNAVFNVLLKHEVSVSHIMV